MSDQLITGCEHGEMHPAACLECLAKPPPPRRRRPSRTVTSTRPVTAMFMGQCPGCNLGIHEGEAITYVDEGGWQHAACAP